jgi:hypothetical protein
MAYTEHDTGMSGICIAGAMLEADGRYQQDLTSS